MNKKILFIAVPMGIAIIALGTVLFFTIKKNKETIQVLQNEWDSKEADFDMTIKNLKSDIENMKSELATGYQLINDVESGQLVTKEDFKEVSITNLLKNEDTTLDLDNILGKKRYKTHLKAGTLLSNQLLMNTQTSKELMWVRDITPPYLVKGMKPGSIIQIRFVLPGGAELGVLDKKEIIEINDNTIRLYVSDTEDQLLRSMEQDFSGASQYGVYWYVKLYNESNLDETNVMMYCVREEMYTFIDLNRNILDKSRLINKEVRKRIDSEIRLASEKQSDSKTELSTQVGGITTGYGDYATNIGAVYESSKVIKKTDDTEDDEDDSGLMD